MLHKVRIESGAERIVGIFFEIKSVSVRDQNGFCLGCFTHVRGTSKNMKAVIDLYDNLESILTILGFVP